MAMSIRERTREVAVFKTLGYTRQTVLGLFVSEAVIVSILGGVLGILAAFALVSAMAHSPQGGLFLAGVKVTPLTMLLALTVAGLVGLISAMVPSYHAAKVDIVEGLRYIG